MKKKFQPDHYFTIGSSHTRKGTSCQDHALSRLIESGEGAIASISDGCSTGGETDVGSRIITLSTLRGLDLCLASALGVSEKTFCPAFAEQVAIARRSVIMIGQSIGVQRDDMLATSGYVVLTTEGGIAHITGDGVIGLRYKNGDIVYHRIEWVQNTPYYPIYLEEQNEPFIRAHGGDLSAKRMTVQVFQIPFNTVSPKVFLPEELIQTEEITLQDAMNGYTLYINKGDLERLSEVVIFTDGVCQFRKVSGTEELIPVADTVRSLMAFKSTEGEFIKRRAMRFLKDAHIAGHSPCDDLGIAGIAIREVEEEPQP
jgi:hypothetical protein